MIIRCYLAHGFTIYLINNIGSIIGSYYQVLLLLLVFKLDKGSFYFNSLVNISLESTQGK